MRAASAKCDVSHAATLLLAVIAISTSAQSASAACMFAAQGEGRVADVIDVRTLRLSDGNVIRLAGIEPIAGSSKSTNELFALVSGRDVTLYGESDMPDRYGRQPAFVFVDPLRRRSRRSFWHRAPPSPPARFPTRPVRRNSPLQKAWPAG
jgi:hypothetical protein